MGGYIRISIGVKKGNTRSSYRYRSMYSTCWIGFLDEIETAGLSDEVLLRAAGSAEDGSELDGLPSLKPETGMPPGFQEKQDIVGVI